MTDRETWAEQRERLEGMAKGETGAVYEVEQLAITAALARIDALEVVVAEACDGWESAVAYKCEHLAKKHGDAEEIARLRAMVGGDAGARLSALEAVAEAAREMGAAHATTPAEAVQALARGATSISAALARYDALRGGGGR